MALSPAPQITAVLILTIVPFAYGTTQNTEGHTELLLKQQPGLISGQSPRRFLRDNCKCESQWTCWCCQRFHNDFFKVHQNLCANWIVLPRSFDIRTNITLNGNTIYSGQITGNDVPPLCYPLLAPLPLTACIKVHSLSQHDNDQLHMCSNATLNFLGNNLINLKMGCVDFGTSGIQIHYLDDSVAVAEPEISLVISDAAVTPSSTSMEMLDIKNVTITEENSYL